jgi:hypothetical protein
MINNNGTNKFIVEEISTNLRKFKNSNNGNFGILLSNCQEIVIENRNHISVTFDKLLRFNTGKNLIDTYMVEFESINSSEISDFILKLLEKNNESNYLKYILNKVEDTFKSEEDNVSKTIGFIGELLFIKNCYEYNPSIFDRLIESYQDNISNGLIDFIEKDNYSFEIKTNCNNTRIHTFMSPNQLHYSSINSYICSINLSLVESGKNVYDLLDEITLKLNDIQIDKLKLKSIKYLTTPLSKEIQFIDYKMVFFDTSTIDKIELPKEIIIEKFKVDFQTKIENSLTHVLKNLFP